jgi:hypothetical protein
MKISIFYSWQNSTDTKYNRYFIFQCIEKAINKIKQKPEFSSFEFDLLEGIRGEAGSPPVASRILDDRIPNSDIFISDLSISVVSIIPDSMFPLSPEHDIKVKQHKNITMMTTAYFFLFFML